MTLRLPLRYPGGKGQAWKKILPLIPEVETIASPFFGGGAVEFNLNRERNVKVYGYDAFPQLVNFWQWALKDPKKLADYVEAEYFPLEKEKFYEIQAGLKQGDMDGFKSAAEFYVINRASFSGVTLSGGMSPGHDHHTMKTIDNLRRFPVREDTVSVELMDFAESIPKHAGDFLFLDPPYMLGKGDVLYGKDGDKHKNFDHAKLAELLLARDNWLITYNDCEWVRDTYNGCEFMTPTWHYGMRKDGKSSEIIIRPKQETVSIFEDE